MADTKRFGVFIWVTWITGILAGDKKCEWAAWYRSHYQVRDKIVDEDHEKSLMEWTRDHDAMVATRVGRMRQDGWTVTVEEENQFKMEGRDRGEGRRAILAGKPDIVGVKPGEVYVIDPKSGKARDSDAWQVRLYLFVLPRVWFKNQALKFHGAVEYRNDVVPVEPLTAEQNGRIRTVLEMVSDDVEPPKSPSYAECRFCDIANCPSRMKVVEKVGSAADVF